MAPSKRSRDVKTDGTDLRPADVQSRRAFIATAAAGVGAVASG
ncbi:MAG: twin-arginine translocation signal domain-containing protein, partial [Gemmatimonadales bacterium]|nr:twin-arginine translocation signal domain-containing protein [Gemmatimonadales bacterium]